MDVNLPCMQFRSFWPVLFEFLDYEDMLAVEITENYIFIFDATIPSFFSSKVLCLGIVDDLPCRLMIWSLVAKIKTIMTLDNLINILY